MISYINHNQELIRDFTNEQFSAHIDLVKKIQINNDFGDAGVHQILTHYLQMTEDFLEKKQSEQQEFVLTKNECVVYDMVIEIVRLCYKYSYNFDNSNDWEAEFM